MVRCISLNSNNINQYDFIALTSFCRMQINACKSIEQTINHMIQVTMFEPHNQQATVSAYQMKVNAELYPLQRMMCIKMVSGSVCN